MQTRSKRQREILDYIVDFVESQGYEPSYQQIARHCGLASKGGVARHIAALEKKGLLKRSRDEGSFHLEVFPQSSVGEHICKIAWLRHPSAKAKPPDEPLFVPRFMTGFLAPARLRAFEVPDDSMSGSHIVEGDIALIERKSFARDGDCVVADAKGDSLEFGDFFRKGSMVEIRPSNDQYETRVYQADKFEVIGILKGLLRKA